MTSSRNRRLGNATIEMTLVGIPMIFVLISIVEMARGMWIYHTLAYAIKEGTRFAIVHGQDCDPTVNPNNNCLVTVGQIAGVIRDAGIGLDASQLQIRMQSLDPVDDTGALQPLSNLLSSTTTFPNPISPHVGAKLNQPLTFTGQYPFQSAISMFWPGAGRGQQFGTFNFPAVSQERIQF